MATGTSDISEDEKKLLQSFRTLKIKPKADTPEDLQQWLTGMRREVKPEIVTTQTIALPTNRRLSIFYGDISSLVRGEALYDQWRYEVTSLQADSYKEQDIIEAIRRSVRGDASRVLMRLGTGIKVEDILQKFDSVYGVVETNKALLAKFYSAKQGQEENIQDWSCRLEDIWFRALQHHLVEQHDTDEMLRSMFWNGLRPEFKDVSGYIYDKVGDFDSLRVELKKIEQDQMERLVDRVKSVHAKSALEKPDESRKEVRDLRHKLEAVESTVSAMKEQLSDIHRMLKPGGDRFDQEAGVTQQHARDQRYRGRHRYTRGGRNYDRGNRHQSYYTPVYEHNDRQQSDHTPSYSHHESRRNTGEADSGPLCFRCNQYGHYRWECTVRLDHSKRLNWRGPTMGGR